MQCCESPAEERSAGNPHATFCGNRRQATASGDPVPAVKSCRPTHPFICGRSRHGRFALKRKSRGDRMRVKLKEIREEMRRRRHQPVPEQGKWLRQVVSGFFEYHAVPTNSRALNTFRHHVTDLWRRSLRRRSQKDRITWNRIKKLADDFLPQARILHPWPHARFAVKHPRWEPSALIGHARICAGGV